MDKIHVIIPVYNAYEDLKICVDSLKKYTDLTKYELIFINDNSTDVNITPFLNDLNQENVTILHNEKNEGFSASINRGINNCSGDVILLNSDTIVTENWIEKIAKCAYSDPAIGTVTPLSNNATLCSVPDFCKENDIPEGYTIDEFAMLIERWSFNKYPKITVAHGFCMFIKREVINKIGLFDAETFARGYGEENDFCFRAEQIGYHHVMCDNTFIYHKGTSSFLSEEKKKYIEKNTKILETRYKEQWRGNQIYCSTERENDIRSNINIAIKLNNNKKNILYLVQADFRDDASNNIGGTQLHVKDLTLGLKNSYNIFVAARDGEYLRLTAYIEDEIISYKFFIGKVPSYHVFSDKAQKSIYREVLIAFSIDIVHIHHTFELSLDMFYEAKSLGITLITTLHDFYYACPCIKLLSDKGELCVGRENEKMCKRCLKNQFNISEMVNYLDFWREQNYKALKLCDILITPSDSAKEIFAMYFPDLKNKIKVIEHGSDLSVSYIVNKKNDVVITSECKYRIEHKFDNKSNVDMIRGWAYVEGMDSANSQIYIQIKDDFGNEELLKTNMEKRYDVAESIDKKYLNSGFSLIIPQDIFQNGKLIVKILIFNNGQCIISNNEEVLEYTRYREKDKIHVAFIGGMAPAKGSQLAYNAIKNSSDDIKWYVFGGIGDSDLSLLERDNLVKTGWYKRDELNVLVKLHKIDVICILPIWPETFCYTLSEALLCGIPVIVTDIGAVGDRVKSMDCGWILPRECDYKDILSLIEYIKDNQEQYDEKLKKVEKIKMRNIEQMTNDYEKLYNKYIMTVNKKNVFDSKRIYEGYLLGNGVHSYASGFGKDIIERMNTLENELKSVYASKTYKALIKLKSLNIPFKQQIKKIVIKSYKILNKLRKI